jgi:hypothetical protein
VVVVVAEAQKHRASKEAVAQVAAVLVEILEQTEPLEPLIREEAAVVVVMALVLVRLAVLA